MKIINSLWYYDNGFYQLASITTFLLLEAFTIMKLDFLLVTKLVKLGTTPHQDMN